jgi:two-component system sensor histidine kinase and response regulator WspE
MELFADPSMLELFRIEVETQVTALENGLVAVEGGATSGAELEPLMRAAHSIKGAARIIGLDIAVRLAHAAEDVLVAAQKSELELTPERVDVLLGGVDLFKQLSTVEPTVIATWLADNEARIAALVEALRQVRAGGAPAVGVASAKPALRDAAPAPTPPSASPAPVVEPIVRAEGESRRAPVSEPPPRSTQTDKPHEGGESSVLVSAETLNRLMGLAGECMVEAHRLERFAAELARLRGQWWDTSEALDAAGGREGRQALARARTLIAECQQQLGRHIDGFEAYAVNAEELTTRLYDEAIVARMRPFADGVRGLPRSVRDLARQLGKKVRLEIVGESTKVDRDILARLEAPLSHLLRNACDHGVEAPAGRRAAGKPEEGVIRLEAAHRAGMLSVQIVDDGRGIDQDAVRVKLVARKLASAELAESLSEAELYEFLFLPGFSTSGAVTEVSGRGVGLDVVQTMVNEVGGSVRVHSELGRGTTFQLQLPLTLSVLRALLVEVAGESYAFPLARVDRVLKLAPSELDVVEGRPFVSFDGRNIGLIPAQQPLGLPAPTGASSELSVVVVSDRLNRYGIVVDCLLGERELVVRPLDGRLGKVPDLSAAAILDDGSPTLIVDVDDLVRSVDHVLGGSKPSLLLASAAEADARPIKRILVVDDSITVREVERRLLVNQGYAVDVAVDGMDGWNRVRATRYDLVISDVDMPRMNGIELVSRIKGDPQLRELPVVIVSYKDREEDRVRGLTAGANYYLTKSSFQDDSLVRAVRDLIGEGR